MGKTAGQMVGTIGGAIGGFIIGGPQGALIGASLGMAAGSLIDPPNNDNGAMPPMAGYPIQRSNKGTPIPKTYGTIRVAGNLLWMGEDHPWQNTKEQGGKGGGGSTVVTGSGHRRSLLIGVCEGFVNVTKIWRNKELITLDGITIFPGDGSDETGIEAIIEETFANYPNTTCIYFHEYELGPAGTAPNFTFEVSNNTVSYINSFICGNGLVHVLDQDLDLIQSIITTGAGVRNICIDPSRNLYVPFQVNVVAGNDFRSGIDKIGTDLIVDPNFFVATDAWPIGVYTSRALRITPDSLSMISVHSANLLTRLHKYNISDGVEDPNATSFHIEGWFFATIAYAIAIDQGVDPLTGAWDYHIYVPHVAWGVGGGGRAASKTNVYDKDFTFLHSLNTGATGRSMLAISEWNRLYVAGWSAENETFSICSRSFDSVVNTVPGVGPALDIETWTEDTDNFYSTGAELQAIIKHGDYIYAAGNRSGSLSVWKFDKDLNLIASADTGFSTDGVWINNLGRVCAKGFYDNAGSNDKNIYVFDTDLNLLETVSFPEMTGAVSTEECISSPRIFSEGLVAGDENPAIIIKDILTNTRYGVGLDEVTKIDTESFSIVEAYCFENDLLYSFSFDRMRPVVDWINIVLMHFNGFFRMSEGKIQLHVYKEETPIFEITRDNLIIDDGEDADPPVIITKRPTSDITNRIEVAYTDRVAVYDSSIVIAMDESDQRASGKTKKRTIQLPGIMNAALAQKMAQRILFESMYRFSTYTFKVGYKDMLLEVGDVGTITDGFMLTNEVIRIINIEEIKDGKELSITAVQDTPFIYEEFAFATQENGRVSDGAPTLVDSTLTITESITEKVLSISITPGGEDTTGWQLYRSLDDVTYELVGTIGTDDVAASPTNVAGTITSNLPSHKTGPVYAGEESLLVSIGTITAMDTAVTDDQFFNNKRLCKIGNEILAYSTCEQTAVEGIWRITGLIRGLFATEVAAHIPGDIFSTINTDFLYVFLDADIGQTIYFKVLTIHGSSIQSLSDVTGTSYLIQGSYKMPLPVSLMRIRDREGLSTYETDDVIIDFYFASKEAGFNIGGVDGISWGSYIMDPALIALNILLEESDGVDILEQRFLLSEYFGEPALDILLADRNGKNPIVVNMTPESILVTNQTRSITITNN